MWRCLGGWEETQPGQVTPTDQRDIPDHMTSGSVNKAGEEGRDIWSDGVCIPNLLHVMGPYSPGDGTCLPVGSRESIPCFASLVCMAFAFPIKLYLNP